MSEASLRVMLNAFADEYPKALRRGKGKSWLAAFRSYLDLIECEIEESSNQIPPRLRRAISELDDKVTQQPFLGLQP
jgi:hypothetical protein